MASRVIPGSPSASPENGNNGNRLIFFLTYAQGAHTLGCYCDSGVIGRYSSPVKEPPLESVYKLSTPRTSPA